MGVRTQLTELGNRPDGKTFEVWEEADGSISGKLGDAAIVGAKTDPLTGGISLFGQVVVPDLVAGDATAATLNTQKIQAALNLGGLVQIATPGVIYIAYSLLIGSKTKLVLGKNTTIKLATATNPIGYSVSSLTSSGTIATITTTNPHGLAIGSSHIMGVGGVVFAQDGYNGLWQMTVTGANTLTFTLPNVISSPAVGRSGGIGLGGPYMEYGAVDNLIRNKNFFSQQYTLSSITAPQAGDSLSVGSIALKLVFATTPEWTAGDTILIKGDTSRYINGTHRVIAVNGTTTTIEFFTTIPGFNTAAPAGTIVATRCDTDIEIEGGTWDGNGTSGDASWLSHVLNFNKTGDLTLRNLKVVNGLKYSISTCNGWRPTFRDIHLETTSDGLHSMGPNWGMLVDGMTGSTNDDFLVHTSNDPEGSYSLNPFPRNTGAVINFPQGTAKMGTVGQGTVDLGGGELIGLIARNIRPTFQNLRILLSGADSAKPFNGMSGIVIDGLESNFVNQSFGGGSPNPQIVICGEPSPNQTSIINDVTIRNWSIKGVSSGYHMVGFDDHNVGGPYANAQVVINNLDLDNVQTHTPLKGVNASSRFFSNSYDLMSIGKLSVRNSRFDMDTSVGSYFILALNSNNANGEYLKSAIFDNCFFNHISGAANVASVFSLGGSTGSRVQSVTATNCTFDSVGNTAFQAFDFGNAGASTPPVLTLDNCRFNSVRMAVNGNGTPYTMIAKGNSIKTAGYNCFVYGGGAGVSVSWAQNLSSGPLMFDAGVNGFSVLSGDSTLNIDLSKASVSGSKGALAVSRAGNGTIGSGQLSISDGTNWRQVSNTTLLL